MAIILALVNLFNVVKKDLEQIEPGIINLFGRKSIHRQNPGSFAVVNWVPGDEIGAAGKDLPPREIGTNPRNLADFDENFTVFLRAHDASDADDSVKQYTITRLLYDTWRASVYRASHGTTWVDSIKWNIEKVERALGTQLIVACRVRAPVPDLIFGDGVEVSPVTALINSSIPNTVLSFGVIP